MAVASHLLRLYKVGGLALLSLFAAALIVSAWSISWNLAAGPVLRRLLILLPALVPASEHWAPRPHAFSLLFLPLAVLLILKRRYYWLIPLFWMWANCHGGVLLGLIVSAAALAAASFRDRPTMVKAGIAFAGCVAAVTMTPLGVSFWIEIPRSLARIRQYPLDEWLAPRLAEVPLAPFWVLAVVFCGLLVVNWRRLFEPSGRQLAILCLPALVLLPLALSTVRNVGPFLMIAVPAITSLLQIGRGPSASTRAERPRLNLAVMSCGTLAVTIALVWAYRNDIPHLHWTPLPETAVLALRQCPDNLYNRYDEGGYLLWFAPDRKVFLDGRQDPYPPDLILEHLRMETTGSDYKDVFSRHQIHCAYLPTVSPTVAQLSNSGWKTLYRDAQWVVLRD